MTPVPNPAVHMLQFVNVLLQRWRTVLAFGAASFLLGILVVLLMSREFQSTATLAVFPPPFKVIPGNEEISGLIPTTMHVKDYEAIIKSDAALSLVRDRLATSGQLSQEEYESYSQMDTLKKALYAQIDINEKTAYGTEYSKIISLTASAPVPELAALMANTWSEVTQELILQYTARTKQVSFGFLTGEYENVNTALEDVEDLYKRTDIKFAHEIVEFDTQTEELKLEADATTDRMLKELADAHDQALRELQAEKKVELLEAELEQVKRMIIIWRIELENVRKDINYAREELKQLEMELEAQPEYLEVAKTLTNDAIWDRLNLTAPDFGLPQSLQSLKLRDEEVNPVRLALHEKAAQTRVALNALPQEQAYLEAELENKHQELAKRLAELHQAEFEIAELERAHQVEMDLLKREREAERKELEREREVGHRDIEGQAQLVMGRLNRLVQQQKEKYEVLASQSLSAKLAVADPTTDIAQIGEAVPMEEPAGIPRLPIAMTFGLLGLCLGLVYVLVEYTLRQVLPGVRALGTPMTNGGQGQLRTGKAA